MTLGAVAAYSAGGDITPPRRSPIATSPPRGATTSRTTNHGRPFVLIGHSQGSLMLQQLIAREIENNPAVAARMKLAIIPGFNVLVPQGKLVGGTFKSTPLCSRPGETGCVIAWISFREKNAPPPGAMFGYADQPGMTVGCVNPARPGSRDWVQARQLLVRALDAARARRADPLVERRAAADALSCAPKAWSRRKCVNDGPRGYLSIRTNADPSDKRTDRIGGEVARARHVPARLGHAPCRHGEAQGDLIREVGDDQRYSSIQNSCSTLTPERFGELEREQWSRA